MGCLTVCLAIVAVASAIVLHVVALPILGLVLLIIALLTRKNIAPSSMTCPNCGSTDVFITSKNMGETTNGAAGASFGGGIGIGSFTKDKTYKYQREGICRKCGFNYHFITPAEAALYNRQHKIFIYISSIILILGIAANLLLFHDQIDTGLSNLFSNSVWAVSPNPVSDFDYYLDGDTIHLSSYEGNSKKIRIATSYAVDGKTYLTDGSIGNMCSKTKPTSIILPEGITSIPNSFFYSGTKYIYLPRSLEPSEGTANFVSSIHDAEAIYYAGSEEEWATLTKNIERYKIDVVKIEYNVSIEELQ